MSPLLHLLSKAENISFLHRFTYYQCLINPLWAIRNNFQQNKYSQTTLCFKIPFIYALLPIESVQCP